MIDYAHQCMRINVVMSISKHTTTSGKRPTNLSLSTDVLAVARDLGMNLSQLCDEYLRQAVRAEQTRRWRAEHAEFVDQYNATLEAKGLPLDEWRSF